MNPKLNRRNHSGQSPGALLAVAILAFVLPLSGLAADPTAPDRSPRITTLSPPGVSVGGRETWTIMGQNLGTVDRIEIEGGGVSAVIRAQNSWFLMAEVRAEPDAALGFRAVRVEGTNGISNLRLIRVDRLTQSLEREPNDTPDQATPLPDGSAGVGQLDPTDMDHFRLTGKKGQRVVIDLEARRLGLDVAPVVTVMSTAGNALVQGRETPGVAGDCRFLFQVPADGSYVVQVRDHLYGGSGWGFYRLRVTTEPFATGLFPLGGPPGRPVVVTASGGNLSAPLSQAVHLPDRPGMVVEVPPFDRTILAPGRLEVGDGPEVNESTDGPTPLAPGLTVNGRIDRPGEVDRFRIEVKTGQVIRFKVVAGALGSWLDSVVTVRDSRNKPRAENDDPPGTARKPGVEPDPDSRLEFRAEADEVLTVEIADRFGRGGPEFGYRFLAAEDRPDFTVQAVSETGAYPLNAGASVTVGCEVVAEGRTGPITLRAEGLPDGVRSAPVVVYPPALVAPKGTARPPMRGFLTLRADPGSAGVSGRFWIVATANPANGGRIERRATQAVLINTGPVTNERRPIVKRIAEFPVRVLAP